MTNEGEVSYGNVVRNGPLQPLNVQTDADIWEQASIVNWNRAVQQERERCMDIVVEETANLYRTLFLRCQAIVERIRSEV